MLSQFFRKMNNEMPRNLTDRVEYSDSMRKKKRCDIHSKFRKIFSCSKSEKRCLKQLLKNLSSHDDPSLQVASARKLRELSSEASVLDYLLERGVTEILKTKLHEPNNSVELQVECAWICANISIENPEEIVQHSLHIALMSLAKVEETMEAVLWTLINVAGEDQDMRNCLLQAGVMSFITNLCFSMDSMKIHYQLSSLVLNLSKFGGISGEVASEIISLLMLSFKSPDRSITYNSIFAVHHLLNDVGVSKIVMDSGFPLKLARMLVEKEAGYESLLSQVLRQMLIHMDEKTFEDIIALINGSVMSRGSLEFLAAATSDFGKFWRKVIRLCNIGCFFSSYDQDYENGLQILSNLVELADTEDLMWLERNGLVTALSEKLKHNKSEKVLKRVLKIIDMMLSKSQYYRSHFLASFEESKGRDNLDLLMFHSDSEICEMSLDLIKKFWPKDAEISIDEGLASDESFEIDRLSPLSYTFLEELHPSD